MNVNGFSHKLIKALALSFFIICLISTAAVVAADNIVIGETELVVSSPTGDFQPQSTQPLAVTITNDATVDKGGLRSYEEEVQTARNLRIELLESEIDDSISVEAGTQTVGRISGSGEAQLRFPIEIGNIDPGTYNIPLRIEYTTTRAVSYNPRSTVDVDRQTRDVEVIKHVEITVSDEPRFKLTPAGANQILAGDDGEVEFSIQNVGTEEANDASVSLSTNTPGTFFGQQNSASSTSSVYLSDLGVNETEQFLTNMGAREDVPPGSYPVSATVEYENTNGVTGQSDTLQSAIQVRPEQSFSLQNITTSDFRVDESDAQIDAELINNGPTSVQNIVVQLNQKDSLTITNGEAAINNLAVGESKPVSFTTEIPDGAEPGSLSLTFVGTYENANGDVRNISTPLRQSIEIKSERDQFEIIDTNTSVTPGGSDALAVTFQYQGDTPVSSVNAKLFTSDPLSSPDDGAYLATIEPNDTVTAQFTVSASGDALAKQYDSAIEVRYDEQDGDTQFSGTLPVGIQVAESESGGPPLLPAAVVGLLVLGGVSTVIYRRI